MSTVSIRDGPIPQRTPLPKLQLFIIFLIQLAEPITATVIFPFVNQAVRDTGIINGDERKTGYYAGLIGSVFFFAEAVTVFHWGWISDRLGRRPILLLGPLGLASAMFSFGLSKGFIPMVVSRAIQGVFNGNLGVAKTVIAEITDSSNIADAYAIMPMTWSTGATLGPIIGGLLSQPADRWPRLFGNQFFHTHPYFLPCAVAGLLAFLSAAIAFFGLKESLPSKQKKHLSQEEQLEVHSTTPLLVQDATNYGSNDPPPKADDTSPAPFSALLIPQVLIPILVYMMIAFVDMSSITLLPLVYSTSIPVGGLGLDAYHIGILLSIFGFVNALVQLFLLGKFIRRFGPRRICMAAQISYFLNAALYPVLIGFARRAGYVDLKTWMVVAAQLVLRLTNGMAWGVYIHRSFLLLEKLTESTLGSIQVIIVDSAPSRASLGATNGMAQAVGCIARSIGPSLASSLFSVTLERNSAGGNMVYIVLAGCALSGLALTFILPQKLRQS
ncbi:hypothetical protein H0H81_007104 [Sphagnurus paluster]|uniref:Major facilitator superfamily (MFS) profile domain-containing protein n=1 Tax=Sphagnurus paluster TaxID=117069 RepID=A0A9P7FUV2_9AGAR|nr:hypothetical protein H0H81_007104 [Sphagnurus paluster]